MNITQRLTSIIPPERQDQSPESTAQLGTDRCRRCHEEVPLEWVSPIACGRRFLPGTGQWRSQMIDGRCPACDAVETERRDRVRREHFLRLRLIAMFGGEKPYREFRFERFDITAGNRDAFLRARGFHALRDNLYLWGPCGVGKTHLACALARLQAEKGLSVSFLKPPQLLRRVRRREAVEEQQAIDHFVREDVLVLDDLGIGQETPYGRQILQEIFDGREYRGGAGLVITGKYSLDALARKLNDDTISSRIAGLCRVVHVPGEDRRVSRHAM